MIRKKLTFLIDVLENKDVDPDIIWEVILYPVNTNKVGKVLDKLICLALMAYDNIDFYNKFLNLNIGEI